MTLVDLLTGRYVHHVRGCKCERCESIRTFDMLADLNRKYGERKPD